MKERHKAHNLGAMRNMIRGITRLCIHAGMISILADGSHRTQNQVMHHSDTLRRKTEGCLREQQVVVDQSGAVTDLNEDILTHHAVRLYDTALVASA